MYLINEMGVMSMENMKYIRMEEFWRFTEWIIENNEKSWQIYDFLFYDTSAAVSYTHLKGV